MELQIKQNSLESDECFAKRKAYLLQYVAARMEVNDACLWEKMPKALPLSQAEKADIKEYWSKFLGKHTDLLNFDYFDVYNAVEPDKSRLKRYIPDSFFYAFIDEYLTHPRRSTGVDDKQLYQLLFAGVKTTEVIARKVCGNYLDADYNPIAVTDFIDLCRSEEEVVVKASISSYGGHAVMFWRRDTDTENKLIDYVNHPAYFYVTPYGTEYVVERVVRQHNSMSLFNPSSINTIRVMTLIHDGECIPLSSVLRMGINGSRVDNCSSGGIVAGITPNGTLKDVAYDGRANKYYEHPQTGSFAGKSIPSFDKAIALVKKLHWRFCGVSQLISWDIAIDEIGDPVVIEMNISYGELDFHQLCNGPIFGDLTEKILKEFKYRSYTYNAHIGNIGMF